MVQSDPFQGMKARRKYGDPASESRPLTNILLLQRNAVIPILCRVTSRNCWSPRLNLCSSIVLSAPYTGMGMGKKPTKIK